MKAGFLVCLVLSLVASIWGAEPASLPEPGPENSGLRLRLVVKPRTDVAEGCDVQIDLLNVSPRPVTVRAAWRYDEEEGDLKDYLHAAASMECVPAVRRWMGGVPMAHRALPQPEETIAPGATLTVRWQTADRHLKSRVADPNEAQNPKLPLPGLYSVHASLRVPTDQGVVPVRSNEQLVSVGGSLAMPKATLGFLHDADAERKTATISLGTVQKVAVGDRFGYFSKMERGTVTITGVGPDHAYGTLEMKHAPGGKPPARGTEVSLVLPE